MEEFIQSGIKKIGLWALVALTVVAVIFVRSQRPNTVEDGLNVFGHVYCVEDGGEDSPVMVRLEEDKVMLLRDHSGIWQNMGTLYRGGVETGAVEVWNTEDGDCQILVMRDGVQLSDPSGTHRLSRVDTLDVGVNTESGSQFLAPQWYWEEETVSPEALKGCSVSGKATLVLNLEEFQEELTVILDGEEKVLPRDRSRAFLLELEGEKGQRMLLEIPYSQGAYRFTVTFE